MAVIASATYNPTVPLSASGTNMPINVTLNQANAGWVGSGTTATIPIEIPIYVGPFAD